MALGEARVEIVPDVSGFAEALDKGVVASLSDLSKRIDELTASIEERFASTAEAADAALSGVTGDGFDGLTAAADSAAGDVASSLDDAASTANDALADVDGDGFAGASDAADSAAGDIDSALADAADAANAALGDVDGDGFSSATSTASSAADEVEAEFSDATDNVENALNSLDFGKVAVGVGAVLAAFGGFSALKDGTLDAEAYNSQLAIARVTLENMGDTAGITTGQMEELAASFQARLAIDDADVITAATTLARFGVATEENLEPAIELAADLGTTLGTDVTGGAEFLAKALENPERAFRRLRAQGLQFDEETQAQILSMREAGDVAGAQALTMDLLTGKIGGVTQASVDSTALLGAAFTDLKQTVGAGLIGAIDKVTPSLLAVFESIAPVATTFGEVLGGVLQSAAPLFQTLIGLIGDVLEAVTPFLTVLDPIVAILGQVAGLIGGLLVDVLEALQPVIAPIVDALTRMSGVFAVIIDVVGDTLAPIFALVGQILGDTLAVLLPVIVGLIEKLAEAFAPIAGALGDALLAVLEALAPVLPVLAEALGTMAIALVDLLVALLPILEPLLQVVTLFIEKGLAPVLLLVAEALAVVAEALASVVQWITPFIESLVQGQVQRFQQALEYLGPLIQRVRDWFVAAFDAIKGALSTVGRFFADVWAAIDAAIQPVLRVLEVTFAVALGLIVLAFEKVRDTATAVFETVWAVAEPIIGFLTDAFGLWWAGVQLIFDGFVGYYTQVWNGLKAIAEPIIDGIGWLFSRVFDGITTALNTLQTLFGTVFGAIAGLASAAFDPVVGLMKGVINGILSGIETGLNYGVRAINALIDGANKVPGVDIGKVNTVSIPRLAAGAILAGPTLAMVGEAGPEAVIPLGRPDRALALLEQSGLAALVRAQGGAGAAVNIEQATFVRPTDVDLLAQKVMVAEKARAFAA